MPSYSSDSAKPTFSLLSRCFAFRSPAPAPVVRTERSGSRSAATAALPGTSLGVSGWSIKVDPSRPQTIWWQWDADFVGFRIVRAVEEQPELVGLRSRVTRGSK